MMIYTFYIVGLVASIILGVGLIGLGVYLLLAAKKIIAGLILLVFGLVFTLVPIALFMFFSIASSVRG